MDNRFKLIIVAMISLCFLGTDYCMNEVKVQKETMAEYNEMLEAAEETLKEQSEYIKTLEMEKAELMEQNERLQNLDATEKIQRVIAAEARGCSLEGQMAVAQTILDRATLWDMTASEVVSKPSQYAPPYQGAISSLTVEAFNRVFVNGERVFEEPVTHFYNYEVCSPAWASRKTERGVIGSHRFMY